MGSSYSGKKRAFTRGGASESKCFFSQTSTSARIDRNVLHLIHSDYVSSRQKEEEKTLLDIAAQILQPCAGKFVLAPESNRNLETRSRVTRLSR